MSLTAGVASRDDVVHQDVLEGGLLQQAIQGELAVGTTQQGQQVVKGLISGGKDLGGGGGGGARPRPPRTPTGSSTAQPSAPGAL
jgi:hypothetical protein